MLRDKFSTDILARSRREMLLWPVMPPPLCDGWAMLLDVSITNTTIMVVNKEDFDFFEKGMVMVPALVSSLTLQNFFSLSASLLWPRATILCGKEVVPLVHHHETDTCASELFDPYGW